MQKKNSVIEDLIQDQHCSYILDTQRNTYHSKDCERIHSIPFDKIRGAEFDPKEEGFQPCQMCFPKDPTHKTTHKTGKSAEEKLLERFSQQSK